MNHNIIIIDTTDMIALSLWISLYFSKYVCYNLHSSCRKGDKTKDIVTQHLTRWCFVTEAEELTSGIKFSEEYLKLEKHINIKDIYTIFRQLQNL